MSYKNLFNLSLRLLCLLCLSFQVQAQHSGGSNKDFEWRIESAYRLRADGTAGRAVWLYAKTDRFFGTIRVSTNCSGIRESYLFNISDSSRKFLVLLPNKVGADSAANVEVSISKKDVTSTATLFVPRIKHWTIYIYPHSHLDIGYTGLPEEVKKLQLRNIDVGIDIAEKTQHYPEGARFVWNPEATWIVKNYLDVATDAQKKKFLEAVRKGWIRLDAGHSNSNLSTFSDEELIFFFKNATSIQQTTGMPISTMVQVDVPGVPWGLVTIASHFGVKGFINFPNTFDLRKQWEHKPFYWLGPDGKTKLLYLQGYPYGIGYNIKGSKYGLARIQRFTPEYDRVSTNTPMKDFLDPFILQETEKLDRLGSPYDIFAMTWSMADNCVIDADLPEAVKEWNERYAYPRLVIAGSKDILDAYETKYSSIIPTHSGDFTEFWTNGLGSDAASVGTGRIAKEELVQAETLSAMISHKDFSHKMLDQAWEDQLLSAEHTWGAQDPRSKLATEIEKLKAGYFTGSKEKSTELIQQSYSQMDRGKGNTFSVINTLSWARNGIVTISAEQSRAGDRVIDDRKKPVLSQRLTTGELIFLAESIPAFGSRTYQLTAGRSSSASRVVNSNNQLSNKYFSLTIDDQTGNISSLRCIRDGYEYVDTAHGLNSYWYLPSVYNGQTEPGVPTSTRNTDLKIIENGPLLTSVRVSSTADGINSLTRDIRVFANTPWVELINRFDKISTREKEGVHFGFGFNITQPTGRIDMPWSIVIPEKDQLTGSNKNWLTFQRWIDISGPSRGVTWSAIESPLVEWGSLSGNILDGARLASTWKKQVPQSALIYSWPLNNHWDTNFPLEQGGQMQQQYRLLPHGAYDVVEANRFGMETHRPLLAVQTTGEGLKKPLLSISNPLLVVSVITQLPERNSLLVRIRSISGKPELLNFKWPNGKPAAIAVVDADLQNSRPFTEPVEIEPYGMTNVELTL